MKHGPAPEYLLYAGSATKEGINLYRFSPAGPALSPGIEAAALSGITALAAHPSHKFLYAVTSAGKLAAFGIHKETGALRALNTVESPHKDACSVTVEKKGWMLLVTYCSSGTVESFRVAGDGGIGESTGIQQHDGAKPDAGPVTISPDNFFLFAPDLERVFQYRFDPARAVFWPNNPPSAALKAGAHGVGLVFRPDEKFAYLADESGASVDTFAYNREAGTLKLLDSLSTLPNNPAAMTIDPSGRFLYVSSAFGTDVTVLAISQKNGTPKIAGHTPGEGKELQVDPTGRYLFLANRRANRIVTFAIHPKTGLLSPSPLFADAPAPDCFLFVPVVTEASH